MASETDRIRSLASALIRQNLKKIMHEGTVKVQGNRTAKININSKETVRAAVKLSIINPFRNKETSYDEKNKAQLRAILAIYDEVFDEVYDKYFNGFNKITNLVQKMNESSKIDTKKLTEEVIEAAKKEYPIYDERN